MLDLERRAIAAFEAMGVLIARGPVRSPTANRRDRISKAGIQYSAAPSYQPLSSPTRSTYRSLCGSRGTARSRAFAELGLIVAMIEFHDPIAFELFKNAVFSIADEMALAVLRTTYSGVLKD